MNQENEINNKNYFGVKHYNVKIVKEKINPFKFITTVISYTLFIWLLLIGATLLLYIGDIKIRAMKGDNTPPKYNAYSVLTGSMLTEIAPKDVVITKKVPAKDLEVGDIMTFVTSDERISGIIVTHRIKNKYYDPVTGKYSFQTKGDNNPVEDSVLAEEDNVIGKVIFKIPKLGYIQELLVSKGGWIIVILIPCLAILSYDIVKLFKNIMIKGSKKKQNYKR